MQVLFAIQEMELWLGIAIVGALFAGLLVPYLWEELRRGKVELGLGIPTGAGDIHPGTLSNPAPDQPPHVANHDETAALSLRSVHLFLISISIVLATGFGVWGLFNHYLLLGALSLGAAVLLVAYGGYFVGKIERA
jgi:hypothetical protein